MFRKLLGWWSRRSGSYAAPPLPPPPDPAPALGIVGYAAVAGVTGGTGGTVYNVSTWAALETALLASGPRIINMSGSSVINGGGAQVSVRDPDITLDGTGWTGILRNYKIIFRTSNVIVRQMAMRTGEGANSSESADRRAITFNPETGATIRKVLLDRCSFAWGPDVVASMLNDIADVTFQYCIFGPALYASNIVTSPNGYGPNITDTAGGSGSSARITYYRCLMILNNRRNFRSFSTNGWDVINCVCYDWDVLSGSGNPVGANLVGNMYKRGPESTNNQGWKSELGGANSQTYNLNSVYFPTAGADRNIGMNANGSAFTVITSFATGTRRTTAYDGGPGAVSHGSLTVATPDQALFEAVVAGAGRTYQDPLDTLIKAHALAGTSDGYYNGPSTGIAPMTSYNVS